MTILPDPARTVAIPGSDATSQDALEGADVGLFEDLRTHPFSLLRGKKLCRACFSTVMVCLDHVSLMVMWTALNLLHYSPVDEN
jgi:hypothetical protein